MGSTITQQIKIRALDPKTNVQAERVATLKKRVFVVIAQFRTRKLDRDNLYGSVKELVDGLVASEIIQGDSEEEIELLVTQQIVKKNQIKTLIEITEI